MHSVQTWADRALHMIPIMKLSNESVLLHGFDGFPSHAGWISACISNGFQGTVQHPETGQQKTSM